MVPWLRIALSNGKGHESAEIRRSRERGWAPLDLAKARLGQAIRNRGIVCGVVGFSLDQIVLPSLRGPHAVHGWI